MQYLILGVIVVGILITGGLLFRELLKIVDLLEHIISKEDDTKD